MEYILQSIIAKKNELKLKKLTIVCLGPDIFRKVAPDIVAEAAMKLETLKAGFSKTQVEAILTKLAGTQDFRLKELGFLGPWSDPALGAWLRRLWPKHSPS